MGKPLVRSFDSLITYPLLKYFLPLFKFIHPIYITLLNIYIKFLSIYYLNILNVPKIFFFFSSERLLDCLDGMVARKYNKCSKIGHYLDKYTDLIFRISLCSICWKIVYLYNTYNIYWYILVIFNIICPGVYILDYINNNINKNLETGLNTYSIYLEDNATLLCFILPWVVYYLK